MLLSKDHRKQLAPTLILAGVLTFLFSQKAAGFMVYFLIFALLILIPLRISLARKMPVTRPLQFARIAVWISAVVLIIAVHAFRAETLRHHADEILAQIDAFAASHGRCAANIEELGLSRSELSDKLGYADYRCADGKQVFFYGATFVIFSTYHYDFKLRAWHNSSG
jgi:hypothetical protein